jgi:hypothetical protein
MKKFVINLERRKDRRRHFISANPSLLGNAELDFIEAVDGKELTLEKLNANGFNTLKAWRDPFRNRTLTKGEVGCFLSHARAWKKCLELNEPIMVFEDDAIVNDTFDEAYYTELMEEYGFLYLSRNENEPENTKEICTRLEVPAYPYNMTAYCIRPDVAHSLLNSGVMQQIIPVDEYLPQVLNHIPVAALKIDAANQTSREEWGSDIEPNSEDDWFIDFKVHPITIGDDRKRCVKLNDSGALNGIYPKNIGINVDWKGGDMQTPGGGMKVNLLRAYIKDLPDYDVVLFTDAFDVFYNDTLDTITKRFLGFNTRALFSAEASCYPDESLADQYPETETPYRFLNSGTFIAEVGELKKIINDPIKDGDDDQLYYTHKFLSGKYNMSLDYEGYIFQTHDIDIKWLTESKQLWNEKTGVCGCIYHGNGGGVAKNTFEGLYNSLYPKLPDLYIPTYEKFDMLSQDMIIVDFMTQSQCEDLIDMADRHGSWGSLSYDKFPAQEIRMKQLGLFQSLEAHWQKHIYPIVEKYWAPIEMYGLRDAFVMRYAMDTQTSLSYHHDASLVTGSVKLNDDYEGAELVFHRQRVSNKDVPVGRCILFPGQVTHGHECMPLQSGVKYSLTMWTKRNYNDEGGE